MNSVTSLYQWIPDMINPPNPSSSAVGTWILPSFLSSISLLLLPMNFNYLFNSRISLPPPFLVPLPLSIGFHLYILKIVWQSVKYPVMLKGTQAGYSLDLICRVSVPIQCEDLYLVLKAATVVSSVLFTVELTRIKLNFHFVSNSRIQNLGHNI